MITVKDLAARLQLHPTTVSKALRDHPDLRQETKDKVKALAEELNYRPNIMARTLSSKRSHLIGAIVPEILTSHHSYSINGFYESARKRGYEVIEGDILKIDGQVRHDPEKLARLIFDHYLQKSKMMNV